MASQNIQAPEIVGLLPAIDRRKVSKPHVFNGRNFLFDVNGPYSGFGTRFLSTEHTLADVLEVDSFETAHGVFIVNITGAYTYDPATGFTLEHEWDLAPLSTNWPWTFAEVGGKYYFCHPGLSIAEYDPGTDTWTELVDDLPSDVVAITVSNGRLIVLGLRAVSWSALDNGADLAPDIATGAGSQVLLVGGNGLMAKPVPGGFICFTTQGVHLAEFAGTTGIFRHRPLTNQFQIKLLSPFAVTVLENDQILFMTAQGLFTLGNRGTEPFDPIFSEYLSRQFASLFIGDDYHNFSLYYNPQRKLLFLSIGYGGDEPPYYTEAYVRYLPTENWGMWNRLHSRLFSAPSVLVPYTPFNLSFIAPDEYVHQFTDSVSIETVDGFMPLDSFIEVGLFRYEQQKHPDELGMVTDIKLSTAGYGGGSVEIEDYNDVGDVIEDWNTSTEPNEDWGLDVGNVDNFKLKLVGTNDGYNVYQAVEPILRADSGADFLYVETALGIYFYLRLDANEVNETFHLKSLELSGILVGRL